MLSSFLLAVFTVVVAVVCYGRCKQRCSLPSLRCRPFLLYYIFFRSIYGRRLKDVPPICCKYCFFNYGLPVISSTIIWTPTSNVQLILMFIDASSIVWIMLNILSNMLKSKMVLLCIILLLCYEVVNKIR